MARQRGAPDYRGDGTVSPANLERPQTRKCNLKKEKGIRAGNPHAGMVLLPLVPRPLGRLPLLLRALQAPAGAQTVQTGVQTPAGAPPAGCDAASAPPAGCDAASEDEEDAALALRFGFHV